MLSRHPSSSTVMSSSYATTGSQRRLTLMPNREMFRRNFLTDVECVVEGQVFRAHRNLLVYFSAYLKKKLLDEYGNPIAKTVYIPRIGSSEFEVLMRYMYSGVLEVDLNNFFEVWRATSALQMEEAKAECLQLLDGTDEITTYFYAYVVSKKLGVELNWQKALDLITHRFEETVFTKHFLQLDLQYVLEILSAQNIGARSETIVFLAALNWLRQDYGSRAFHAVQVMECVRFSCMSMEEVICCYHPPFLRDVVQIQEVQLMLLRATCFIAAKSQGEEHRFEMYANPKRNLFLEELPTKLWHKVSRHSEDTDSTWPKYAESVSLKGPIQSMLDSKDPEQQHLGRYLFGTFKTSDMPNSDVNDSERHPFFKDEELDEESFGSDQRGPKSAVSNQRSIKELKDHKSAFFSDSPKKSEESQSVIFSDKSIKESGCILVIGGIDPETLKESDGDHVIIFNLKTNDWIHYVKLPEPRHNHCSACIGNSLYVVGGCNSNHTSQQSRYIPERSCYKLNLEKTKWTTMSDMLCARYDHAMVVSKGRLFVIGGQDENGRLLNSMEMYDPKEKLWKLSSNLCCGRKAMGAAVFDGRIWIVGGIISSPEPGSPEKRVVAHVDLYHPDEKKWYFSSFLLPSARCHCFLIEFDGKLYCIGGMVETDNGKQRPTDEVCFVHGENELWKLGPPLPEPRLGGIAVICGENLYYVGGYNPENSQNIPNVFCLTTGATSWSIGPPMISGMFGLSAVSFGITEEK